MKNQHWTQEELALLSQFSHLRNSCSSMPKELCNQTIEAECLAVEAKLCIFNKYVVGYSDRKKLGIFSFTEISTMQRYCRSRNEVFTFHPVNFKTFLEHQAYKVTHRV